MIQEIRFTLVGLGNVGRNLLDILVHRSPQVAADYRLRFALVGAADSSGAAIAPQGLDMSLARDIKFAKQGIATYPNAGHPGMTALRMVETCSADMLVDASPTNLQNGEPGLSCVRAALGLGQHVITANKGTLVLAYDELMTKSRLVARRLLFSATVAGGLPTVNIGVRDLAGSDVRRIEGVLNGTTNYILTRMEQEGLSHEEALKGAQEAGIAESDPTLDVDGWDAANKLVILANSVLRQPTKLGDVQVEGIRGITLKDLLRARTEGRVIKLVAQAERSQGGYTLTVKPTPLAKAHPLARTGLWDMGVVYHSDYMGTITAVIEEKGPVPTSAAVLRDMINACRGY